MRPHLKISNIFLFNFCFIKLEINCLKMKKIILSQKKRRKFCLLMTRKFCLIIKKTLSLYENVYFQNEKKTFCLKMRRKFCLKMRRKFCRKMRRKFCLKKRNFELFLLLPIKFRIQYYLKNTKTDK